MLAGAEAAKTQQTISKKPNLKWNLEWLIKQVSLSGLPPNRRTREARNWANFEAIPPKSGESTERLRWQESLALSRTITLQSSDSGQ